MKYYVLAAIVALSLSSCLKESIPDAMLASKNAKTTVSISYEVNGNAMNLSVSDFYNWNGSSYSLSCRKNSGYYSFDAGTSLFDEVTFDFNVDSLAIRNYKYTGADGTRFIALCNMAEEYVYAPSDSMSFNVTSYTNGRISGNFSGVLTPQLFNSSTNNSYFGTAGSVHITNGSFKNVPVFY